MSHKVGRLPKVLNHRSLCEWQATGAWHWRHGGVVGAPLSKES
jgi:hypothetical protein